MFAINRKTGLEIVGEECICTQAGSCGVLVEQQDDGTWVLDDDAYNSFENESGDDYEPQGVYYDADGNECVDVDIEFVEVLPERREVATEDEDADEDTYQCIECGEVVTQGDGDGVLCDECADDEDDEEETK